MGQGLLIKSGSYSEKETNVPQVANACQILVKVKWPDGTYAKDIWVNCKDGSHNYNYHTDQKGEVLFSTNSGSANINITNLINQATRILDAQAIGTINVDAPIGTIKRFNYTMNHVSLSLIDNSGPIAFYNKDINNMSVTLRGGGGGGASGVNLRTTGYGGGGAYQTIGIVNGNAVTAFRSISYTLGRGGYGGTGNHYMNIVNSGGSGGTTSIFGLSAAGGAGGSLSVPENNGKAARGANSYSNYQNNSDRLGYGENGINGGAGGGGGYNSTISRGAVSNGGYPGGGRGGYLYKDSNGKTYLSTPTDGTSGGGGGAGLGTDIAFTEGMPNGSKDKYYDGGNGGNGIIHIECRYK